MKKGILTKNQCRFFSNDPSTPPLLLLLFGWKNKLMYLIMRATIAVIIFLLSSNQLPLVCHSKKLLIINNIGECFLSASSATSSYLCCPFVARFEVSCHPSSQYFGESVNMGHKSAAERSYGLRDVEGVEG